MDSDDLYEVNLNNTLTPQSEGVKGAEDTKEQRKLLL